MRLRQIAHARNGFTEKFGIPRQSRENSLLVTRIVFEPEFRVAEALRGIEGYSHLWLIWGFSANRPQDGDWSPTVRPPRLGGNTRMGVFATRSPYRPNPLGLTSVRLLRVEETKEGLTLLVSGADLLDGTPIYDIKPYLSFSDSHPDAKNGFAEAPKDYRLRVEWSREGRGVLRGCYGDSMQMPKAEQCRDFPKAEQCRDFPKAELEEILSQDPRPAYQDDPERVYGISYGGWEVKFRVEGDTLWVLETKKTPK